MNLQMSVNTSYNSLSTCLFITCCTIYLTSEIKPFNIPKFKSVKELSRVKVVIFNGIGRLEYLGGLQTLDRVQGIQLNIQRK